jgi:lipid II:glycine glycyltransferase (peptidoglycan interpeptide bridge formation enzyme)
LLFAELDGRKIASIIFYTDGKTMSYAHAAALTEFRKVSPAVGLGLYAMLFAHREGCQAFDWFGAAPENWQNTPDAKRFARWSGFTQFKLSFGGQRVTRLGTWELPLRRGRYALYRLLLRLLGR